jgi:general stress protein 26
MRATTLERVPVLLLALIAAWLAAPLSTCAEVSGRDAQALAGAKLIYIATVRKDGNESTAAPVWFTMSSENKAILIQTGPQTWKARRIKRGSPVLVWIGTAGGPAFIGKAEITSDAGVQQKILADMHEKYWENRVMGVGPSAERFKSGDRIAIMITPVRDLPDGFSSGPGTPAPKLETSPSKAGS